jgi:hypothetical protein
LGSNDLDNLRRTLSQSLSCKGNGVVHSFQLALEFPSWYVLLDITKSAFSNHPAAFFTPFITGDIDFRYGYVFAACNFLGGLIVYFFVIEGQGRTLEEIDTMYIEKVQPWKSNKWIAPPPHEIARIRKAAGTHEGDEAMADVEADANEKDAEKEE